MNGVTARLISEARAAAGLSQRDLARRAGTSQPSIVGYEAGRVTPDIDTLSRLLTACGRRLVLESADLPEDDLARLRANLDREPAVRVRENRRATALAARASRARHAGRTRSLTDA